jgi:hypothetical protein
VGIDHAFVYVLEGEPPGAAPRPHEARGDLLARAQAAGVLTVRKWDRWPDWWYDPELATRRVGDATINRDWRLFPREGWPEAMQVPVYNDCRLRATGIAEWVMPLDADEFAHPMGDYRTVPETLAAIKKAHGDGWLTGVRMCAKFWSASDGAPLGLGSADTTTTWAWDDNGSEGVVRGDGCHCARWWKTALHVAGLRDRLAGNNMHDAEKEQSGGAHLNADACAELAVSHLKAGAPPDATDPKLGSMRSDALRRVAPCIAAEAAADAYSLPRLRQCVADAWQPVRPPPKTAEEQGYQGVPIAV